MLKSSRLFLIALAFLIPVSAGAGGGFAVGSFLQRAEDFRETKENAITYNCAAYNSTTGVFEWRLAQSADSIVLNDEQSKKMIADQNKQEAARLEARKAEIAAAKKKVMQNGK